MTPNFSIIFKKFSKLFKNNRSMIIKITISNYLRSSKSIKVFKSWRIRQKIMKTRFSLESSSGKSMYFYSKSALIDNKLNSTINCFQQLRLFISSSRSQGIQTVTWFQKKFLLPWSTWNLNTSATFTKTAMKTCKVNSSEWASTLHFFTSTGSTSLSKLNHSMIRRVKWVRALST